MAAEPSLSERGMTSREASITRSGGLRAYLALVMLRPEVGSTLWVVGVTLGTPLLTIITILSVRFD